MKNPRVTDDLISDKLGNSALARSAKRTVLVASEFRNIKRTIDVFYISAKFPKNEQEVAVSCVQSELEVNQPIPMFGRLTEIAGKWNGKNK